MNFKCVGAVFEIVRFTEGFRGEFARLANQYDSGAKLIGKCRADDEPAGLNADNLVDMLADITMGDEIYHPLIRLGVSKKSGDILEYDPFLGEVGDIPDNILQIIH
jgi:hypothetical protein